MKKKIMGKTFADSGIEISLSDILDLTLENKWQWAIYEFDAIGSAPDGLTMPESEELALSTNNGFNIT